MRHAWSAAAADSGQTAGGVPEAQWEAAAAQAGTQPCRHPGVSVWRHPPV